VHFVSYKKHDKESTFKRYGYLRAGSPVQDIDRDLQKSSGASLQWQIPLMADFPLVLYEIQVAE